MRRPTSLFIVLILAMLVRMVPAFAAHQVVLPVPDTTSVCSEAHEGHTPTQTPSVHADTKQCQLSCDLAAAPAIPVSVPALSESHASLRVASWLALAVGTALPPDHPPPIR